MAVITGNDISLFRLKVLASGINLEMKGLRKRGKACSQIVREEFGFKGNKAQVLNQLKGRISLIEKARIGC